MNRTLLSLLLLTSAAQAAIKLPSVISDHMVVQAGAPVPIWGWAEPGEKVSLELAGQTQATEAGPDGRWKAAFNNLKAGNEPQMLTVKGSDTITVNDVLVGEVWLASGQSNMALTVDRARDYEKEKAAANHPLLRMFTVTRGAEPGPQADCGGKWEVCMPEVVGKFSAVAYFFGRDLQQQLQTPVGLLHSSVGGTDIAAWTSMEVQQKVPELKSFLDHWKQLDDTYDAGKAKADYQKKLAAWKSAADKAKEAGKTAPRKPAGPTQPHTNANYPARLFDIRLEPLIPYGIKGAIWYQGEHNCGTVAEGLLYRLQLPLLINDWRARWGSDFPFAWVQLPGYGTAGPGRAYVREAQLRSLSLKNTGMVVTLDVGDASNNHPTNKQDVGKRLAWWALGSVYKKAGTPTSSPLVKGHEVHGGEMVLNFAHADKGLVLHERTKGFVIAGEDKQWKPATARIDGGKVIVSSAEVPHPAAVRYAWGSSPDCPLFNGAGLPASPFRTDDWTDADP